MKKSYKKCKSDAQVKPEKQTNPHKNRRQVCIRDFDLNL
jgi:hypothetical protein